MDQTLCLRFVTAQPHDVAKVVLPSSFIIPQRAEHHLSPTLE